MELTSESKSSDFACPCCGTGGLDEQFLSTMLQVQAIVGDCDINSGYRCATHNKTVGGYPDSMHLVGRALDFNALTVSVKTKLLTAAHKVGLKGIGLGSNFIHLDNREKPAQWTYPKKY